MAYVMTVLGAISVAELGFTYTHEHLISRPPEWKVAEDPDLLLDCLPCAVIELRRFYAAGGRTLVEGTAIDYGRDVRALESVAKQVPVHIVCTTGFNKGPFYPQWVTEMSIEELEELFERELLEGIDGTSVRAGYIKVGTSYNRILPTEEKVLRAAARVQKALGVPVWCHTEVGTMGLEVLDVLESEGANLKKVAVGHSDRNPDWKYHEKIYRRGAYVQFDGIGKVKYYPDSVRVELIKRALDAGFADQILVSGDMGRRSYLTSYGGGPGFDFIIRKFTARLREEIGGDIVETLFVRNPARWLEMEA